MNTARWSITSAGQPIPTDLLPALATRLGEDVARIRLHTDPATAERLGCSAYTIGRHVVFADRDFNPRTPAGFALLVHEAAHAVQQGFADPPAGPLNVDPDPVAESEAEDAEHGRTATIGNRVAPAIQRHRGPFCPNCPLPQWIEMGAGDRAVWLPANQAIELAYAASHSSNTVLYGSMFEGWRDIRLPSGLPNKAGSDAVLNMLRGRSQQLAPDIIDFTERVVYEIKTAGTALAGQRYLDGIYPLLDSITTSMGGPHFNRTFASWVPPQMMPMPAQPNQRICTAATTISTRTDGLLLYQVYRRTNAEEEAEAIRRAVVLSDLNPVLGEMADRVRTQLIPVSVDKAAGTDLWIIASPEFYQVFVRQAYEAQMQRTLETMRVKGATPRENPLLAMRQLGWTAAAISLAPAGILFLVVSGYGMALAVGGTAAAAGGTAAAAGGTATAAGGTAAGGEMVVYSLAAYRAAKAAQVAAPIVTKAAAGVLFMVSTVSVARAEGNSATVIKTGSVRAVPANEVGLNGVTYELDRKVTCDGQDFFIIGRATVR